MGTKAGQKILAFQWLSVTQRCSSQAYTKGEEQHLYKGPPNKGQESQLRELMLNRNSTIAFSVHSFSLKKPLRPSPLTGCTCVDVCAADLSVEPLLNRCNGKMRIFLGNSTF